MPSRAERPLARPPTRGICGATVGLWLVLAATGCTGHTLSARTEPLGQPTTSRLPPVSTLEDPAPPRGERPELWIESAPLGLELDDGVVTVEDESAFRVVGRVSVRSTPEPDERLAGTLVGLGLVPPCTPAGLIYWAYWKLSATAKTTDPTWVAADRTEVVQLLEREARRAGADLIVFTRLRRGETAAVSTVAEAYLVQRGPFSADDGFRPLPQDGGTPDEAPAPTPVAPPPPPAREPLPQAG